MKKLLSAAFIFTAILSYGQQDLQFTQYMFNRIYYNPGVAGSGDAICINALHRSQWVGFDGAPTTQNINANIPINAIKGGLGVRIANDQIGFFQNINAGLGYAYQWQLPQGELGIGVSFDLFTKNVNAPEWTAPEGTGADIVIPALNTNSAFFDMAFGLYYQSDNIWGGVSTTRLLESAADLDPLNSSISSITRFYNKRHYFVMGGYNWQIPASNFELRPSFLLKSDFASSPVVDVNVMAVHNNKIWGGVTYRLDEAMAVNIGYQFSEAFGAGYAYDIPLSDVSNQGGGSHEIFLKYCFEVKIEPRERGSYKNIRFL